MTLVRKRKEEDGDGGHQPLSTLPVITAQTLDLTASSHPLSKPIGAVKEVSRVVPASIYGACHLLDTLWRTYFLNLIPSSQPCILDPEPYVSLGDNCAECVLWKREISRKRLLKYFRILLLFLF